MPAVDARKWGPQLRFCAPPRVVENFYREFSSDLGSFILYGSGDFHYLSALWLRRVDQSFVLVSFDNHPDWAITPPRWACGNWINRALELPHVQHVAVWGLGNFEYWWPNNIFGNRRAESEGRLEVHPWAGGRSMKDQELPNAILRENWRERFEEFATNLRNAKVYVTVDLDCLRSEDAVTNWENGRFTVGDLVWALEKLRAHAQIVGGDICGACSEPKYARWTQKFASNWDHPKVDAPNADEIRKTNFTTLLRLWPALTNGTL